ncbi:MAG TPA: hypothetical protein VFI31_21045, partial [Pirellulales bacterium]|nr:hypothetical protein [Pirellulales bacterium]
MEWLEERQLLTWVATFVNSTGALTIQGVGTSSDTGVLKVDPNSGEILLDGNNSGNFADTGANLATINSTIQIQAGTTINSNFIIDNNAGAFFEAPANFPANAPMFNYTGSSALDPNDSLTIRGTAGVANTFEVALSAGSNQVANGTTTGLAGVPPKAGQPEGVLLAQPPNQLNQRNELLVTFGPDPNVPNSTGITGHLILDGMSSGTNSQLYIDDAGAILNPSNPGTPSSAGAASDWTLNGNTITGPQLLTPTSPPTPTPPPGTAGNITYANMDGLHFNDTVGGEHLFVNSVATNTFASDAAANTTVVNYKQPLAFPFSLQGSLGGKATLDIVGAANGNNSFYVDSHTVALAPTGTKPQYNTPFTHLGADLTYTVGSLANLNVSGNGGNNIFNVQVPPTLIAPYTSDVLPANLTVYGGSLPPVLAGTQSPPVTPGTSNLLRVLGNGPGPLTTGADNITVQDLAANNNGTNAGNVIQMSGIAGVVIYGEGGNDALTNASVGNPKTGQPAVSALLIGGDGNDTLTGGGGSDMMLGGGGQNTLISKTSGTVGAKMTTNYFFPHQDQFGNIYDPLLNPSDGDTTSVVTGAGG